MDFLRKSEGNFWVGSRDAIASKNNLDKRKPKISLDLTHKMLNSITHEPSMTTYFSSIFRSHLFKTFNNVKDNKTWQFVEIWSKTRITRIPHHHHPLHWTGEGGVCASVTGGVMGEASSGWVLLVLVPESIWDFFHLSVYLTPPCCRYRRHLSGLKPFIVKKYK